MSEVAVRIYLGNPYRQLTANEAIVYLANGLMPIRIWRLHALDADLIKFNNASEEERRTTLLRDDPVIVSAGTVEYHESIPTPWFANPVAWHPIRGTEIDIRPRHTDPSGRVMLSLTGPRASNTDNARWLLQTLGSAQQIAISAEIAAPVIEQRNKEND